MQFFLSVFFGRGTIVKCYEIRQCTDKERESCYVWNSFRDKPDELENVKCWVLKDVYHVDNRDQLKQCLKCKYYLMMNAKAELVTDFDPEVAMIRCDGVINYEKTRGINEVWAKLKKGNHFKVVLDLTEVENVYSCGLGAIVKMHKECREAGGMLVVVGVQAYVKATLESTKLSRLLFQAPDRASAKQVFDRIKKKEVEQSEAKKAEEAKPKERVPCWEYFKNHNPRNATTCDECFTKINPTNEPCWIVDGIIEGVSFQYVNEDCEECEYFREFGTISSS